ncbi:hypothetical protein AAF712_000455 [Marasmius tenuissimus]|uniref:Uncharacterized protein n=1 Tax=Marasmius tenuissimus TaxID=585030 RepID=A0ABR3AFJ1_9AGAR
MIAMFSIAFTLFLTLATQVSAQATPPVGNGTFNVTLGTPSKGFTVYFYNQLLDFPFTGTISPALIHRFTSAVRRPTAPKSRMTWPPPTQMLRNSARTPPSKSYRNASSACLNKLIAANKPMPDVRAGSTPILGGYLASCTERNLTEEIKPNNGFAKATDFALALPPNWDGPTGIFVPTVGLVLGVGTGTFLAVSSILLLSNM